MRRAKVRVRVVESRRVENEEGGILGDRWCALVWMVDGSNATPRLWSDVDDVRWYRSVGEAVGNEG